MATAGTSPGLEPRFLDLIAREAGCGAHQVGAAAGLFTEGATVPFVARYRKEVTGGLTDEQLEKIAKQRTYFLELAERRDAVLASIGEQGKLTPELEKAIRDAVSKQTLEDLYLPYKPKRRTRAQVARERGLEPLADRLIQAASGTGDAETLAAPFVDPEKDVADAASALAGARDILAERLAENAAHRSRLRDGLRSKGTFKVRVVAGKEEEGKVYKDYFEHGEAVRDIPSHRLLAILRGERDGFLISDLAVDDEAEIARLARAWQVPLDTPCGSQVAEATTDGYKRLLRPSITNEVRGELRERAEAEAIGVFRANLEALLMQSPIGQVPVMGVDPGYRTGCKVAVVDRTGRVAAAGVIHPFDDARRDKSAEKLVRMARQHRVHAMAVGNGTASRETDAFVRKTVREAELGNVIVAIVPETGASVYSASAVAREELPDLDVSLRGAVSIARRLQDPLAELVKIEPRSLGVGQYQHDVNQKSLSTELGLAVEGVVNRVGVELNTASPALLRRVSGLSERMAHNIVAHRDVIGRFNERRELLEVSGFGPKTYVLAAGFLRLAEGHNPLDRTAVHPERYTVVERMAREAGVRVPELVGNPELVATIDFDRFLDAADGLGKFTLADMKAELERPGRDPRPDFEVPKLREDVVRFADLKVGMELEGRVSNVTNFGAFVDVGIKRDGLVHLSELSEKWVEDPRQVVQVGQIVKVRVIEVDRERERIGLSMKPPEAAQPRPPKKQPAGRSDQGPRPRPRDKSGPAHRSRPKDRHPAKPATLADLAAKFNRRLI